MAHLEIGTFGESQGDLLAGSNYLEDGAKQPKGLQRLYSRTKSETMHSEWSAQAPE